MNIHAALFVGFLALQDSKPADVVGHWQGTLIAGPQKLRLVVHLERKDGVLTGSMDSIDQGAYGLPITKATVEGSDVRFEIKSVGGSFKGELDSACRKMDGELSQGGAALPLVLERTDKPPEMKRPQEPKPPYPYAEEEVSYPNEAAGLVLAGTLTVPRGKGPFPAVLLITGSGPQNRDEELMGHKPFKVIADALTRRGIAVLRVDDRGVGKSTGSMKDATSEDFAGDVLAGIAFLRTRKEVDTKRVGLLGHSEGGLIAPMVANRSKDVAFCVLLAGTALIGEEILYLQGALIARAAGASDDKVATIRKAQEQIFELVREVKDEKELERKVRAIAGEAEAKRVSSKWFRYFMTYDPSPALERIACPVLALFGEKDLQVPAPENGKAMEAAFAKNVSKAERKVETVAGVNHLFQACTTGGIAEYAQIEETMQPAVLKRIADWILAR